MSYLPLSNLGILTNQNYLSNPDAESSTSGFNVGSVTLSSGVPSGAPTIGAVTAMSLSRDTTNKLVGGASFKISAGIASGTTPAGSAIISDVITISDADLAKVLSFGFSYKLVTDGAVLDFSGTSTQSMELWVYNVGLAAWSQPAGFRGINTKNAVGQVTSTFQTDSSNASNKNQYRLAIIFKGAISSLTEFVFDQAFFSSKPALYGAPVTDWVSYTPTIVSDTLSVSSISGKYRRDGDSLDITLTVLSSGSGTGTAGLAFSLPSGYFIDTAKIDGTSSPGVLGNGNWFRNTNGSANAIYVNYFSSSSFGLVGSVNTGVNRFIQGSQVLVSDAISVRVKVPIVGWSSTVQMSNDTDTRVVAAAYTGATTTMGSSPTTIIFPTAVTDTHAGYNTTTGIYTVPVSGLYKVSAFVGTGATVGIGAMALFVSQTGSSTILRTISRCAKITSDSASKTTSGSALFKCIAGDTLKIQALDADGNAVNSEASFSIERLSGPSAIAATETVAAKLIYGLTTSQVVNNNAVSTLIFDVKEIDTHNAYNTSTGIWTCPVSGKYHINSLFRTSATSSVVGGNCQSLIAKNGLYKSSYYMDIENASFTHIPNGGSSVLLDLKAGDQISMIFSNSLGTSVTMANQSNSGSDYRAYTYLEIYRIGN